MVKFQTLWAFWAGFLAWDVVVGTMGWFSGQPLAERLETDFAIAYFIFAVWIVSLIQRRASKST